MAEGLWVLWQEVGVRKESRHQDEVTEADAHTIENGVSHLPQLPYLAALGTT